MARSADVIAPWTAAAWAGWTQRFAAGRIPHALLIGGSSGLGKRDIAMDLAQGLLCQQPDADRRPCARCRACTLLAAGTHPDFHRITFAVNPNTGKLRTEIIVEQIRELRESLAQTSQFGGWRVALVDPAEAMNDSASNALLKTLEEPEADAVLILVSDRPSILPATIRSRCQRIDVRLPSRRQALDWLCATGIDPAAASFALDLAAGNPGLARRFASDESRALFEALARDLVRLGQGHVTPVVVASSWLSDKEKTVEWLTMLSQLLRVVTWAARGCASVAPPLAALSSLTAAADFHKLAAWWDRANALREQLRAPLRHDLLLTELLGDFCALLRPSNGQKE